MTAYARKRQTENTQKRAAKHKTTGRSQENNGRKKKGVRVSAYLLPDLCSLEKGGETRQTMRGPNKRTVQGPELKGPERQTPFILPKNEHRD